MNFLKYTFSLALPLFLAGPGGPITSLRLKNPALQLASRVPVKGTIPMVGSGRWIRNGVDTSLIAQLATITTDTGAFAPGHHQFARYETPGQCWAAAANEQQVFARGVSHIEQRLFAAFDTTGLGAAAAIAQTCGTRFTLANTPRAQLGDLFKLALYEQNDSLAEATLARRLADRTKPNPYESDDPERAAPADLEFVPYRASAVTSQDVREAALLQFLVFGRFAAAKRFLAQVDQTVPDTATVRLAMHRQYAEMERAYDHDTVTLLHEDSVVIRLGLAYRGRFVGYHHVLEAYRDFMRLAVLGDSSNLLALEQRAKHDLATFSKEEQIPDENTPYVDWRTSAWTETQEKALVPEWYRFVQGVTSRPAPRLHADFWFPASGQPASDTVIPVPGKYNLICGGGIATDKLRNNDVQSTTDETTLAIVQAVHLKQWMADYGKAGLVATVIRAAIGAPWMNTESHESKDIYVRDSAAEAGFWHWYDQGYHQLPVTEGIVVLRTTERFPPPDNRRIRVVQMVDSAYFNLAYNLDHPMLTPEEGACTLVDPNGRILYQRNMAREATYSIAHNDGGTWSEVLKWVFTQHAKGLALGVHP